MGKYNTIIWDLDGTLLNTLDDLMDSANAALSHYGIEKRTRDEIRAFVGNGVLKLMEQAVPQGREHPDFEDIYAFFKEHYGKNCNNKTKIYDGLENVLKGFYASGYKMAIVSNKLDSAVKALNGLYFSDIISVAIGEAEDRGIKKKPAPDTVFEAMRMLGAEKDKTVYIGDSEVDILTAANAGIDCISVLWGFRDEKELLKNGAAALVKTPEELESYIIGKN